MKDYYKILGVRKNASFEDIRNNYLKLVHVYHPDKNGGDDENFKEINEAYQVLSNKQKRGKYDQIFNKTYTEPVSRKQYTDDKNIEQNGASNQIKKTNHARIIFILFIGIITLFLFANNDTTVDKKSPVKIPEIQDSNELLKKLNKPINCKINNLEYIENHYKTYSSGDVDLDLLPGLNQMKLYGIIKNNSDCVASSIKMKIILADKNNTDITQEEINTLSNMSIQPGKTNEYKTKITVYDTFMTKPNRYSIDKILKENIQISMQIISADFAIN